MIRVLGLIFDWAWCAFLMLMLAVFATLGVLGLCCDRAYGGWGPVACVAVAASPAPADYSWADSEDGSESYLYRGRVQVGGYSHLQRVYRPLLDYQANKWGEVVEPPIAPPIRQIENFGVETSKLRPDVKPSYKHDGKEIDREAALALVKADQRIPDDLGKLRLTVIGPQADRDAFLSQLSTKADAADIRDRVAVFAVPPDHWTVKEYGFAAAGKPTIYLQSTDPDGKGGKVLHRQDDNADPDVTFQAIRKAIKDYDSTKDPDRRRMDLPANMPVDPRFALPLVILGAAGGGFAMRRHGAPAR